MKPSFEIGILKKKLLNATKMIVRCKLIRAEATEEAQINDINSSIEFFEKRAERLRNEIKAKRDNL